MSLSSKYLLAFALVFAVLALGCVSDEQDAPSSEPLDDSVISSVDADLDAIVSDMDESSRIAMDLEDDINIDELELIIE